MAQIIKHRRGSITQLKDVTARISELVVATGSIGDLNGPFLFVGETEGVAGAYRSVSKIYQGSAAPTITVGSHGSVVDGTPFYASGNKSLYILSKDGNARLDLTGNIEGNTISNVTITSLTGSNANYTNLTGSTFTSTNSNITSLTGSNARVTNVTGGTLTVTGTTNLGNNLYITGSTYQTGSIDITGDITLGGNITIGNQTTDIIQFGGEVSSSILPIVHNSFDLGSPSKNWRNLHVSGTAYVNILEAQSISLDGITVFEDLVVSGSSYLGQGGGDQVVVSGSLYNDQLTEKRLVVAGTNGLLTNYSGLTFDNGNLNLSGALEVTNIQGTGSLYLKADEADSRYFEIYNTGVSDTHIKSNGGLSFFGDDTNYLKIDDNAGKATLVGVNGVSVSSSLDVTGSAQFSSTINVDGVATVSSSVVEDLTQYRVVGVGSGGALIDYSSLTFDGTTLKVGDGQFEVDTNDGDIRTSGSLTTDNIYGKTNTNNSLHLNGGDLGAPHVELESAGQISLFSEGVGSNYAINMTGSVHMLNDLDVTGSLTVSGSTTFKDDLNVTGILTVTGETRLQSNLYVSGNLEVLGSSTNVNIQSSTIELDDNIIRLNAYSPFERYAGFEVIDSGSSGLSGSMLWDSLNDYWMFVSSSGQSSKMIGTTAGAYGSENSLTNTYFPIATGPNTIGDSLLRYSGTTLSFNTNKFTIDSGTGDTLVSGNFTLSYSGGTDNGTKTSAIMFRNSSNVVGFVSTTETTDVLDGVLGYKNSTGALVFSTVIDGGTY